MVRLSWLPRRRRFIDDQLCRLVEIRQIAADRSGDEARADVFVDAVGGEQEDIAFFQRNRLIVDFDLRIDPQRAAEIGLLGGNDDPVIVGQLLECVAGEPVDAAIAGVKDDAQSSI